MNKSALWNSLGTHDSLMVIWRLCISSSGEARTFDFLNQNWTWRSRSIAPQNNRDLNQGILHLWSKFGDPSLNGWWIMVRTSSKWGKSLTFKLNLTLKVKVDHTRAQLGTLTKVFCTFGPNLVSLAWTGDELSRGQTLWWTDGRTQATTISGGQNWSRVKREFLIWVQITSIWTAWARMATWPMWFMHYYIWRISNWQLAAYFT